MTEAGKSADLVTQSCITFQNVIILYEITAVVTSETTESKICHLLIPTIDLFAIKCKKLGTFYKTVEVGKTRGLDSVFDCFILYRKAVAVLC